MPEQEVRLVELIDKMFACLFLWIAGILLENGG